MDTNPNAAAEWIPPENIGKHAGTKLSADDEFFAAPPAEIGEIWSAQTTLKRGRRPWRFATRLLLSAIVAGALAALALPLLGAGLDIYAVTTGVALGPSSWLIFYSTRFAHECTFVGSDGVARFELKGNRQNEPRAEILRFCDAAELKTRLIRKYWRGRYIGTFYGFSWLDAAENRLFELSGRYQGARGVPHSSSPVHFAWVAEHAWSYSLFERKQDELERLGYMEFRFDHGQYVRVAPEFLELRYRRAIDRILRQDICDLGVVNGAFTLRHRDSLGFDDVRTMTFDFSGMPNSHLFLIALEQILEWRMPAPT